MRPEKEKNGCRKQEGKSPFLLFALPVIDLSLIYGNKPRIRNRNFEKFSIA